MVDSAEQARKVIAQKILRALKKTGERYPPPIHERDDTTKPQPCQLTYATFLRQCLGGRVIGDVVGDRKHKLLTPDDLKQRRSKLTAGYTIEFTAEDDSKVCVDFSVIPMRTLFRSFDRMDGDSEKESAKKLCSVVYDSLLSKESLKKGLLCALKTIGNTGPDEVDHKMWKSDSPTGDLTWLPERGHGTGGRRLISDQQNTWRFCIKESIRSRLVHGTDTLIAVNAVFTPTTLNPLFTALSERVTGTAWGSAHAAVEIVLPSARPYETDHYLFHQVDGGFRIQCIQGQGKGVYHESAQVVPVCRVSGILEGLVDAFLKWWETDPNGEYALLADEINAVMDRLPLDDLCNGFKRMCKAMIPYFTNQYDVLDLNCHRATDDLIRALLLNNQETYSPDAGTSGSYYGTIFHSDELAFILYCCNTSHFELALYYQVKKDDSPDSTAARRLFESRGGNSAGQDGPDNFRFLLEQMDRSKNQVRHVQSSTLHQPTSTIPKLLKESPVFLYNFARWVLSNYALEFKDDDGRLKIESLAILRGASRWIRAVMDHEHCYPTHSIEDTLLLRHFRVNTDQQPMVRRRQIPQDQGDPENRIIELRAMLKWPAQQPATQTACEPTASAAAGSSSPAPRDESHLAHVDNSGAAVASLVFVLGTLYLATYMTT